MRRLVMIAVCACCLAACPAALGAAPSAGLTVHVLAAPSSFSETDDRECFEGAGNPGEFGAPQPCDQYDAIVTNSGSEPAGSPVVLVDTLPAGLRVGASELLLARDEVNVDEGESSEGQPLGECESLKGGSEARCEYTGELQPDERLQLDLRVRVQAGAASGEENVVEALEAGRRVASSETADVVSANDLTPPFGPSGLLALIDGVNGAPDTQAGDHPYELAAELDMATGMGRGPETGGRVARAAGGGVRDVAIDLPPGLIGSALAAPMCTLAQLQSQCPAGSLVGHIDTQPSQVASANSPIYNLVPEYGVAVELGFLDPLNGTHVLDVTLAPTPQGYVARLIAHELPDLLLWNLIATIYGDPAARNGGGGAAAAMFTDPTDCSGEPLRFTAYVDSWEHPGTFYPKYEREEAEAPDVEGPGSEGWASTSTEAPPVTGCDQLRFDPSFFSFAPEPGYAGADEPSGYALALRIPQSQTPETLATPPLKSAVLTLPAGVSISPAAADGLQACSASQFGFTGVNPQNGIDEFTQAPATCPEASKIGTVEVVTPLLEEHLTGSVFLAAPGCGGEGCEEAAEDGGLFGLYLEVGSDERGLHIKLVGKVEVGGEGHRNGLAPGQLRTSFEKMPQAPFSELKFKFTGGPRAPLANPQSCGAFTTEAELEPWSAPQSGPNATERPSFTIAGGCPGGFAPGFEADMANPQAGAYGPFTTTFSRQDGEQDLSRIAVEMPAGLLAKIAGVTQCGEPQADAGTCPESSRVGAVTVAVGSGADPLYQSGSVYLTGPYDGHGVCAAPSPGCAPFGLSVVVPAIAGPYDFGPIVTRAKIEVNPRTAQVTVTSNPLPQSVDGVPLRLRELNIALDRENFMLNPTDCTPTHIAATVTSVQGASATGSSAQVSEPFQAANCAALGFKPQFVLSTSGKTSRQNGASLHVKLVYPKAPSGRSEIGRQANLASVKVDLPKQLVSRLATLQGACLAGVFEQNPAACPASSRVGTASVSTPVLPAPPPGRDANLTGRDANLSGPAYFVSRGGVRFPELIIVLQGDGVTVDLSGETLIDKAGVTSSTFRTIPDVPVETFELNLPEGSNSALAANGKLCQTGRTVTVAKRVKVRVHGHVRTVTRRVKKKVGRLVMPTALSAQNGAVIHQNTPVSVTGCPPARPKAARRKAGARKARGAGRHR